MIFLSSKANKLCCFSFASGQMEVAYVIPVLFLNNSLGTPLLPITIESADFKMAMDSAENQSAQSLLSKWCDSTLTLIKKYNLNLQVSVRQRRSASLLSFTAYFVSHTRFQRNISRRTRTSTRRMAQRNRPNVGRPNHSLFPRTARHIPHHRCRTGRLLINLFLNKT